MSINTERCQHASTCANFEVMMAAVNLKIFFAVVRAKPKIIMGKRMRTKAESP